MSGREKKEGRGGKAARGTQGGEEKGGPNDFPIGEKKRKQNIS